MRADSRSHRLWNCSAVLLVGSVVVGFWLHTSAAGAPVLGKYGWSYFGGLLVLTAAALAVLRVLLWPLRVPLPRREPLVLGAAARVLALLTCGAALATAAETALALRPDRSRGEPPLQEVIHPFLQTTPLPGEALLGINRWGFRGAEIDTEKPDGVRRVFVLGGSTVFCRQVELERTHVELLGERLRAALPGVRIEVQNAGMDWHTSLHSVIKLCSYVQEFDPDLLVVFHGINDLCRSFSPPQYARGPFHRDYRHYLGPMQRLVDADEAAEPPQPWPLWPRLSGLVSKYFFSDLRRDPLPVVARAAVRVDAWPSLESFEANLVTFATLARAREIPVLFATQGSLYREDLTEEERAVLWFPRVLCGNESEYPDLASMVYGMTLFNETTRRVARREGVPCADLDAALPKTLDFFLDDVHYTERGNEVVADVLAAAVLESSWPRASDH